MYFKSCVRYELPHEGPPFLNMPVHGRSCGGLELISDLITCSRGDQVEINSHVGKSTVMSGKYLTALYFQASSSASLL